MKSLIKKILKEETENDDQVYLNNLNIIVKILKLVPVSKYTCAWAVPKTPSGDTTLILKLVPEYMTNENKDIIENTKISKIIMTNINSDNSLLVHSIPYDYEGKSCEEWAERSQKLKGFIMVKSNNRK